MAKPLVSTGVFTGLRRVGLGSVDPQGRLRLDAIADFLQDVATEHDEAEADPDHGIWVLRRLRIELVGRRPRYGERIRLQTFCGGLGSRWAERRTSIEGESGVGIECAAIWVRVTREGRPALLSERFVERNRPVCDGRTVSARREHADPTVDARSWSWSIRRVDLDTMGHVNNAAHWRAVEEALGGRRYQRAEIEFRDGLLFGTTELRVHDDGQTLKTWLVQDGKVRSSAVVALRSE